MVDVDGVADELLEALSFAFGMFWEVLWALILGFAISAAVQAVVSKREMRKLMPDDSSRSLAIACGLGAASSSCSYAAVAMARSVFRRGADFTAAMAFEFWFFHDPFIREQLGRGASHGLTKSPALRGLCRAP